MKIVLPYFSFVLLSSFFPLFCSADTASREDTLGKRNITEKFMELTDISADPAVAENISLYYSKVLVESTSELDNITTADEEERKEKGSALYTALKRLTNEEKRLLDRMYKLLSEKGYIDTATSLYTDNHNLLLLGAKVTAMSLYVMKDKKHSSFKTRVKIRVNWNFRLNDEAKSDTLSAEGYSELSECPLYSVGAYFTSSIYKVEQMIGDAFESSLLRLKQKQAMVSALKFESNRRILDSVFKMEKPVAIVQSKEDAGAASVIIKTTAGHGSGFAITNNGYVLCTYHLLSTRERSYERYPKVILPDGSEFKSEVIRVNRQQDLVLLKVDHQFEKAFQCLPVKAFKSMQDVYTIGAPKSIELGQSVSSGIISNERKMNNSQILQMNMSVNTGNSGGPVFDEKGNLHGIIMSKLVGENTEGVCFAVPAYLVNDYLKITYK